MRVLCQLCGTVITDPLDAVQWRVRGQWVHAKETMCIDILLRANIALNLALSAVEWVDTEYGYEACPWCCNGDQDGHKPDCIRQQALAIERGNVNGLRGRGHLHCKD